MELKIEDLKYDKKELNEFLQTTNPNKSFAFVLGFRTPRDQKPVIASTKKEGFEIITLKGYIHKK
jgi:hypothetical protein